MKKQKGKSFAERTSKNFEDFAYIISEINRINIGLSKHQRDVFSNRTEFLYCLSNPEGTGITFIGQKADKRFYEIAKRAHRDPQLSSRATASILCKTITHNFQEEILRKKNKLTQALADRMISRAVRHVKTNKLKTIKYFWPCVLPDDSATDQFCIGPVIFTRTVQLLEKKKKQFMEYTDRVEKRYLDNQIDRKEILTPSEIEKTEKDIRKFSKTFVKDLRKYYQQFPWIAEIEIFKFEEEKSTEITNLGFNTALNILRLFFPYPSAREIGQGSNRRGDLKTVMLTEENGELHISLQGRFECGEEKGWVQKLTSGEGGRWISTAGSLIPHLYSGGSIPLLYQRFINALWWYGEALVQEDVPCLKVISLTNSLEAFLGTTEGDPQKLICSQISKRAALLLSIHNKNENWEKRIRELYGMRSALVHGRIPAFDQRVLKQIGWGTRIAHGSLMEGLSWTLYLAQNTPPKTIQEIDDRFEIDLPLFVRGNFSANSP
ncbi:hypothetical protein ACTRXD_07810 [Nitrospira sp. T9]|uniref:hypothetical protein n=1 Tax=unclassified Nitrospira TaxID=2652172 RepID=UPI003F9D2D9C